MKPPSLPCCSSAAMVTQAADEDALQLPRFFPMDFTLFRQQMWASTALPSWEWQWRPEWQAGDAPSLNGRQGRLPSAQPLSGSKGHSGQHSLSSPSQGNHRAPRPAPAREAEIPTGRKDRAGRDFPVCFRKAGAGCPGVCVCVPWKAWTDAGALRLGLVFVSPDCQRRAILVGFASKLSGRSLPLWAVIVCQENRLNFEISPFIFRLPDPASAADSRSLLSGQCPTGTTQIGNGGGEISAPKILLDETRMSGPARGPGQAARSSPGPRMSLSQRLPELLSAGSGGRAAAGAWWQRLGWQATVH